MMFIFISNVIIFIFKKTVVSWGTFFGTPCMLDSTYRWAPFKSDLLTQSFEHTTQPLSSTSLRWLRFPPGRGYHVLIGRCHSIGHARQIGELCGFCAKTAVVAAQGTCRRFVTEWGCDRGHWWELTSDYWSLLVGWLERWTSMLIYIDKMTVIIDTCVLFLHIQLVF